MKNKIVVFSVLAVFAMFTVIAVPSVSATYPANAVYFEPEDSSAKFCENTYVQIMVNASVKTTGAGMDIYFDPNCVNITNVDFTGTPYNTLTGWRHYGNYVRIGVMGPMTPIGPGIHLVANLTLHCEKTTYCISDLAFTATELLDEDGDPLPDVTWHNGTFTCVVPDLVVEKSVTIADGNFTVSYTVKNIGCGTANASHVCKYVNGTLKERKAVPALGSGASHSSSFEPEPCPCGATLNVTVCADCEDEVAESNETNNCEVNIVRCPVVMKPDLNVTEITVNYDAPKLGGRAVGPEPGPGVRTQCNNISAMIEEDNGVDVLSPFDVTFKVGGTTLCTVRVPGLPGGATKTVYCNCSWRPMAGDDFAINVTVDSNNEIPESDETNNTLWNNGTVVSNGYKGDGWQGPSKNLTNVQCHPQDTINLIYSVGDSYYARGGWGGTTEYVANWTASDLPVPEGADIEKAWLYVYYCWDKDEIMPGGVSLTFNENPISFARHYSDRKGFGSWNYPYGMLVYDVTTAFNVTGNTAVLTKPDPKTYIPIKGMLLMVVYKHPDEPERIICIDEGYDMINAQASYGVTPEEATTYATFVCCEPIPLSEIGKASLVAVAPGASKGDDKNRLSFNDGLWKGAWSGFAGSTELGIAETDVLDYLKAEDNVANFQDRGDWMEASNAFLILEKPVQSPLWHEINKKLDALIANVSAADMPNIIKQRLIGKLEYAKDLKDNAKEECEAGNFDAATKKLGVAKSQVESFASMVRITRRISSEDKESFLADAAEIIAKIDELIEYIETEHKC
ncbi:MAG: DUF3344 domain-containing protein [Methanophagales archaeon]|nr:DUF3344 domain-containing protein [Methanophagales archaeon]